MVDVELLPLRKQDLEEDAPVGDVARNKKGGGKEDVDGPDAREDYDEDEDDEDEEGEEEQGKWGGRNKIANGDEGIIEDEDAQAAKDNLALEEQGEVEEERSVKALDFQMKQILKQEYWKSPEGVKLWEKNRNLEERRQFEFENREAHVGKGEEDLIGLKRKLGDMKTNDLKEDAGNVEDEFKSRRMRVKEVCKKYNLGPMAKPGSRPSIKHPPTPNYDVFYIDR